MVYIYMFITMSHLDPVQSSSLITWHLIRFVFVTIPLKADTVISLFVYMHLQYDCICLFTSTCILRGTCDS